MKPVVIHKEKDKVEMRAECRAEDGKDKVEMRAECRAEDGKKHIEKVQVKSQDVDTLKYIERKLADKGVLRLDRHPADGLPLKHHPKKGHGGKYSWEGPDPEFLNPPAMDEKDPNYVDEKEAHNEDEIEAEGLVVGEIETPKAAKAGIARIEVDPHLKVN